MFIVFRDCQQLVLTECRISEELAPETVFLPACTSQRHMEEDRMGEGLSVLGSVCWLDTLMSKKRKPQLSRCLRQTDGEIHGTLSWWVTEVEEHSPLQAVTPSQVVWKTRWGSHGEQAMFPHGLCFICSCLKSLYRFSFMIDYKLQDEINTFL